MSSFFSSLFDGTASKFWAAVLSAVGEVVATGNPDWKTILAAVAGVVVVYMVPNKSTPVPQPPSK